MERRPARGFTISSRPGLGRVDRRTTHELIGICRGVLADGWINQDEAIFLLNWIERNGPIRSETLIAPLYQKLCEALQDGTLDPSEEGALLDVIHEFVGGEAHEHRAVSQSARTPLDDPPPLLDCIGNYVVTGGFSCAKSRSRITAAIEHLGGRVSDSVVSTIDYVLIGNIATASWAHSSYGRKIEAAVKFRDAGHPIALVSESHWLSSFPDIRAFLAKN